MAKRKIEYLVIPPKAGAKYVADRDIAKPQASFLFRRFGRVTSGGRFFPCIDGLRCLAIVAVLLYHLNGYVVAKGLGFTETDVRATHLFHWLDSGNCGVPLFFSISGFILALPFAREISSGRRLPLKLYYARRLTRLEPPFLINLAIVFLLLIIVNKRDVADLFAPMLATMSYTHNLIYGTSSYVNGVTWSLEIEVQFYLLAPFIVRTLFALSPQQRRMLVLILVGSLILFKFLIPIERSLQFRLGLLYQLEHFLVGILMADLFVFRWNESPKQSTRWDLLTALVLVLIFGIQQSERMRHLLPLLSLGLLACVFRGRVTNRVFSTPAFVVIGGMCYSIYLYHYFVISMVGRLLLPVLEGKSYELQMMVQTLINMPVTLAVCAGFFVLIERPFMQWRPGKKHTGESFSVESVK